MTEPLVFSQTAGSLDAEVEGTRAREGRFDARVALPRRELR